jgi:putative DNA primase/helicase
MERQRHTPEYQSYPEPLEVNFAAIPERLRTLDQWVVWNYALVDGDIKKPPFSPITGTLASVRNPATWGNFAQAHTAYETGEFAGVGIVVTADMGIVGVDIDHCIVNGQVGEEAQRIITALDSYTEVSPSGSGIRMLLEGKLPGVMRRRGNIELYEDLRYFTITGQTLPDTPQEIKPRHQELYRVYQRLFTRDRPPPHKENTGVGGSQPAM